MARHLLVKAGTLARACWRAWRRVLRLQSPLVLGKMLKGRLEACQGCEFREGKTCGICGCFIEAKIRLRDEQCPVGTWTKL